MVLFLHNRYRTVGGEERTVEDLLWLVREYLHEPAELLERPAWSRARTIGMYTLRGYLVIAVLMLIVKAVEVGIGH